MFDDTYHKINYLKKNCDSITLKIKMKVALWVLNDTHMKLNIDDEGKIVNNLLKGK